MAIRKRKGVKGEPWVYEYTDPATGKRHMVTPKSGLKKDAEKLKREIDAEIESGIQKHSRESVTFAICAEEFIKDCFRRGKVRDHMTNGTARMYETSLKRVVPLIGANKLTAVTGAGIQSAINELSEKYKPVTVGHSYEVTFRVLDYGVRREWLKRNVLRDYKVGLPRRDARPDIPTPDDLRKVFQVLSERGHGESHRLHRTRIGMIVTAMCTGMRGGEISGLLWRNVDFERNVIKVRHSLSRWDGLKSPKSKAGVRDIPMMPPVRQALIQIRRNTPLSAPDDHVFLNIQNGPISSLELTNKHWQTVAARAGFADERGRSRFRLHSLRHAAASLFIAQGLSPLHVKSVIGHASISTTMDIYGHLFPEDEAVRTAVSGVAERLFATQARLEAPSHCESDTI